MRKYILSGITAVGMLLHASVLLAAIALIDNDPGYLVVSPTKITSDILVAPPALELLVFVVTNDTDVPDLVNLAATSLAPEPERLSASIIVVKSFDLVVSDLTRRTGPVSQLRPG